MTTPATGQVYTYEPAARSSYPASSLFGVSLKPMDAEEFLAQRRANRISRGCVALSEDQAVELVVGEIRERLALDDQPNHTRPLLAPPWIKHSAVLRHLRAAVAAGGPLVEHEDVAAAIREGFRTTGPVAEAAERQAHLDAAAAASAPITPRAQR